jgi:hypothetical protein
VKANTRAFLIAALIIFSAGYASLIGQDEELARTLALGYIAVVITIILLIQVWKKPNE